MVFRNIDRIGMDLLLRVVVGRRTMIVLLILEEMSEVMTSGKETKV